MGEQERPHVFVADTRRVAKWDVLHFDKRGRQLTQRDFASGLRQYFQGAQWMERAVHIKDANGDILLCYDGYFYLWRLEFLRPVDPW